MFYPSAKRALASLLGDSPRSFSKLTTEKNNGCAGLASGQAVSGTTTVQPAPQGFGGDRAGAVVHVKIWLASAARSLTCASGKFEAVNNSTIGEPAVHRAGR
jgi:hypothetical protein